jgi:transcriptional regulator with XRE-family HTH domain|tara:strand:+ start:268 stop:483 length:216 start_codon:yes stop_codon:yes gene_type:complete
MSEQTPGERIKEVRESLGLSQRTFASMIGVTAIAQNRWERNKAEPSETIIRFVELIATLKPGADWLKLYSS